MKKSPKKIVRDKFFCTKIPDLYGDQEIYPTCKNIRSLNKQLLRSNFANVDNISFKSTKKGFTSFY